MNYSTPMQHASAVRGLKKISAAALGALALMSAAPAMADVIDFESQLPDIFLGGMTFEERGFTLLVQDTLAAGGGSGFAGALVNGLDPYSCGVAVCPSGNSSIYFMSVNDGSVQMSLSMANGQGFRLSALDYGFMVPVGGLPAGILPGKLTILGEKVGGGTVSTEVEFAALNGSGSSPFLHATLASQFAANTFSSVQFSSCLYDGLGGCSAYGNQSQFAIDNIEVAAVPEPQTYAMMGLGLAAIGLLSRRRRASHNV
ncbi:NF038120 family PEP-CTERM protein [Duganella fentianensis]|uniref:NF038120 family PEP-CTERM protein n=1 Tax=Duganella fentianensis TaxID=2692177 RepID=UPI0032B203C2